MFFIVTTERTTYTKYLVEAESRQQAEKKFGIEFGYLGYVDGETEGHGVSEGFATERAARESDAGWTEGK